MDFTSVVLAASVFGGVAVLEMAEHAESAKAATAMATPRWNLIIFLTRLACSWSVDKVRLPDAEHWQLPDSFRGPPATHGFLRDDDGCASGHLRSPSKTGERTFRKYA